jgi:hypothetical protein
VAVVEDLIAVVAVAANQEQAEDNTIWDSAILDLRFIFHYSFSKLWLHKLILL